jgi:hypothetical protein
VVKIPGPKEPRKQKVKVKEDKVVKPKRTTRKGPRTESEKK